ncbi:putative transcription factor B3-Domain family [Helianthus annuus]|nr:putative transcription factor B3-Domain family [Helianthus annuus]
MMNTVPAYPVVILSSTNCKWFVRMEEIDCEVYITTGWNRIKQEMSITDNHLVVFEMVDIQNFEISVFSCDPALLSYPPKLCFVLKQEINHDILELSDDETANQFVDVNAKHNEAEGVPLTFRVDNHYVALRIVDSVGRVWDVEVAIEFSNGCPRYYVLGMKDFVRDKNMAAGDVF